MKYQSLIFDLDDTLFDTWGQLQKYALKDACQAMLKAGLNTNLESAVAFRKQHFSENPRKDFWIELGKHFGATSGKDLDLVIEAGKESFYHRSILESIELFPGTKDLIKELRESYQCFLVTAGNPETQYKKLKKLDLESSFDAVYCVDPQKNQEKTCAFQKIIEVHGSLAASCLSIGNRMDKEIKEAKELGMDTCLVLKGEYLKLSPQCSAENPDYKIAEISELLALLKNIEQRHSA